MSRHPLQMFWLSGVLVSLAWGAGAFGSNYPWAYTPLLIASAHPLSIEPSRTQLGLAFLGGFGLFLLGTGSKMGIVRER